MRDAKIVVLGGGVSGLISCIELEKAGYSPVLIEKNDFLGGRVATKNTKETPLDVGFQVLLTEYPAAKQYLDLEKLQLKKFLPGCYIHKKKKKTLWGDPTRNSMFLFPLIFSRLGTIGDKLKINSLQKRLKNKSIKDIFSSPEVSTIDYLHENGFSKKIIKRFFQPFFAGIFLEEELTTSSRMFEFVFKLFAQGQASIPKKGMSEIALQLKSQLKNTNIILGQKASLKNGIVSLESGESMKFDYGICTYPETSDETKWKSCENLYFLSDTNPINLPIIGLFTHKNKLVNNYHFVNDILDGDQHILSVTVVKQHNFTNEELAKKVSIEISEHLGLKKLSLIKHHKIQRALPDLKSVKYEPNNLTFKENVIYTGDYTAQGSINSAMLSGKKATKELLLHISRS